MFKLQLHSGHPQTNAWAVHWCICMLELIQIYLGVQDTMKEAQAWFRDESSTQFVVVTIPTSMGAAESVCLAKSVLRERVAACCSCMH